MQPSTTATEFVTVEQFLKGLGESGLLPAGEVRALVQRYAAAPRGDARALAQELLKQQKLTHYQASMLGRGRSKGLVLAGNYVVLEKLGQGGMGMVFKARDRRLDRIVALKVLPPAFTKKPNAVQRFQREVQAAARLVHPNIVASFDAGQDGGAYFLVMEFVDGSDLSRLVKQHGPLGVAQAVGCILQAARGLEHAHGAGIIHRDVKPGNLLLDRSGTVKILDMGLARFEETASHPGAGEELTQDGSVLGTCDYMAPEQALNSKTADQRADIYGLGCTLWYLLTGKTMYAGENMMEKLLAHRNAAIPSLRGVRPEVSKQLDAVYQRLVAKAVEDRYQSLREAIVELASCCSAAELAAGLPGLAAGNRGPVVPAAGDSARGMNSRTVAAETPRSPAARKRFLLLAGTVLAVGSGLAVLVLVLVLGRLGGSAVASGRASSPTPAVTAREPVDTSVAAIRPTGASSTGRGVDDQWIALAAALGGKRQAAQIMEKLRELNPGLSQRRAEHRNGPGGGIIYWDLETDQISDISALRGLPALQEVRLNGSDAGKGKLSDLAPLQSLQQLRAVSCGRNPQLSDLKPLQGLPLKKLAINMTNVSDLSALQNMPLENLDLTGAPVRDLSVLRKMPLTHLAIRRTQVDDLTPLKELPQLEVLAVDVKSERDLELLRSIRTLKEINDSSAAAFLNRKFPPK